MRLLAKIFIFVAISITKIDGDREVNCTYWDWADERGYFSYCGTFDFPLTSEYKNEAHRFSESRQRSDATAEIH